MLSVQDSDDLGGSGATGVDCVAIKGMARAGAGPGRVWRTIDCPRDSSHGRRGLCDHWVWAVSSWGRWLGRGPRECRRQMCVGRIGECEYAGDVTNCTICD